MTSPDPIGETAEVSIDECPDDVVDAVRRAQQRCETVTVARVVGTVAADIGFNRRLDTLVTTARVVLDGDTPITEDGRTTIAETRTAGEFGEVVDA